MSAATGYSTLLLDQSQWDLVLDANGNIAVASPPYSIAQDVASAVRTFLGEVYYNTQIGLPWWTQVFGKLPSSSLLIELINQQALTVPGVVTANTIITSYNDRNCSGALVFTDVNNQTSTLEF